MRFRVDRDAVGTAGEARAFRRRFWLAGAGAFLALVLSVPARAQSPEESPTPRPAGTALRARTELGVERRKVRAVLAPGRSAPAAAPARSLPSGKRRGIWLFPAPGTDPVKPGIVVPEDYELPAGYVRHYQTTDDGRALPAILMFSPDYEFFDEDGKPLQIPADRIVPPELAPPDLRIEMLDVSASPGKADR